MENNTERTIDELKHELLKRFERQLESLSRAELEVLLEVGWD